MHELSLAQNIIEIIQQSVPHAHHRDVRSVCVRVGAFTNVLADSLVFCFEALRPDAGMDEAQLEIVHVPARVTCQRCDTTEVLDELLPLCPQCGSRSVTVIEGNELLVTSIEIVEPMEHSI